MSRFLLVGCRTSVVCVAPNVINGSRASWLVMRAAIILLGLVTAGCTSVYRADSPDVIYSASSAEARELQVPPDLTDLSTSEQFVLPGNTGGPVSRNTLLPAFDTVEFVRDGTQSWLEIQTAPDALWPSLLDFLNVEGYRVEQTEPTAGVIVTQWQAGAGKESGNLLSNVISDDDFGRVAFRLERNGDDGTRLFARNQVGDEAFAKANPTADWPETSGSADAVSPLLQRLLVYLGVEEQKSRGILNDGQARAVLDDAIIQTTAAGSQLILQQGYLPAFRSVGAALETLDYSVDRTDNSVGQVVATGNNTTVVLVVTPVHVSAVRISALTTEGTRLPVADERQLLEALRGKLA